MSIPGQRFLNEEFREIVETSAVVEEPEIYVQPNALTVWDVWTWYAPQSRWGRRNGSWTTKQAAVDYAEKYMQRGGHVKAVVVRIELK